MPYTSDSYYTKLDLLKMFVGDTLTIPYVFFYDEEETEPINLTDPGVEAIWNLCPYGQYDYPVLSKKMSVSLTNNNLATVALELSDTVNLNDNRYTFQPILRNVTPEKTREYIRYEGDALLFPRIRHEVISTT